jgi:hypothetical protein
MQRRVPRKILEELQPPWTLRRLTLCLARCGYQGVT